MSASEKKPEEIAAAAQQNAALYLTEIPPEADAARRLLEQYSGIAPVDVDAHIRDIRDQAWAVFPYGGIGSFSFLNFNPALQDPRFQAVAARLTAPGSTETFLDVGCAFGTVVRQLVAEGVPGERLFGTDLQPRFLDLGYELFRDRESSSATFVAGDMLKEDDARLDVLNGRIDVIYASAFFHLFERQGQAEAAKRMVRFLNPRNPRAMIFGLNGGPKIEGWEKYVLDADSWRGMWEGVGEATGTTWRTEMDIIESNEDRIRVRFAVYRAT
ncbi:hypothetical protein NKR19_g6310 [Coniochaeta hoffmannii]|uniref:Methyltransferase domain-containing protein n=1 Tax=Coniochaeta hoffmannii TaxID=91930 RepID=A0AA38VIW2_9PEZI|nr:hypothetical protein NKR19_g6310 [Coniochaeta hoffmannii]